MSYQNIARKWRPQRFDQVIGQDPIVHTLLNALKRERVGAAYLFAGLRGTGKTSLARLLAKALNCENPDPSGEPCNHCTSCQEITKGHSLDVIEVDGASNRGIDDIRNLNESVSYSPSHGRYKIYIIDEVHMLTKEAFNALLKTLEEPPAQVKFFFATTEPHKVLPTILSRTQRFDLSRISDQAIINMLKTIAQDLNATIDEGALSLIARLSEGSLRDAQSLLDQIHLTSTDKITEKSVHTLLGLPSLEPFFAIDEAITKRDVKQAFDLARQFYNTGYDLNHFIQSLAEHYKTHLTIKLGGQEPHLSPEQSARYQKGSGQFKQTQLLTILDYLFKTLTELQKKPITRLELEMILLHLTKGGQGDTLAELVTRLEEMEERLSKPKPQPAPSPKPAPVVAAPKPQPITPPPPKVEPAPLQEAPLPLDKPVNSAPPAPKPAAPPASPPKPISNDERTQVKMETLLRFAGVELNGSVTK